MPLKKAIPLEWLIACDCSKLLEEFLVKGNLWISGSVTIAGVMRRLRPIGASSLMITTRICAY